MIGLFELNKDEQLRPCLNEVFICKNDFFNLDICYLDELINIIDEITNIHLSYSEHSYICVFDDNGNLIGLCHISMGNNFECEFYIRIILIYLSLLNSNTFILIHNHPNNICCPSEEDIINYNSYKSKFDSIGYNLLDSIIITENNWYSIDQQKLKRRLVCRED